MRAIKVHAFWDWEADVWVASSDDVAGLATEAPTIEALADKLKRLVPELVELNEGLDAGRKPFRLMIEAERQETVAAE